MRLEAESNQTLKDPKNVQERAALTIGVSLKSVQNVAQEIKEIQVVKREFFDARDKTKKGCN